MVGLGSGFPGTRSRSPGIGRASPMPPGATVVGCAAHVVAPAPPPPSPVPQASAIKKPTTAADRAQPIATIPTKPPSPCAALRRKLRTNKICQDVIKKLLFASCIPAMLGAFYLVSTMLVPLWVPGVIFAIFVSFIIVCIAFSGSHFPIPEALDTLVKMSQWFEENGKDNFKSFQFLMRVEKSFSKIEREFITPEFMAAIAQHMGTGIETALLAVIEGYSVMSRGQYRSDFTTDLLHKSAALIAKNPLQTEEIVKYTRPLVRATYEFDLLKSSNDKFCVFFSDHACSSIPNLICASQFANELAAVCARNPLAPLHTPEFAQHLLLVAYAFNIEGAAVVKRTAVAKKIYAKTWKKFPWIAFVTAHRAHVGEGLIGQLSSANLDKILSSNPVVEILNEYLVLPSVEENAGAVITPEKARELAMAEHDYHASSPKDDSIITSRLDFSGYFVVTSTDADKDEVSVKFKVTSGRDIVQVQFPFINQMIRQIAALTTYNDLIEYFLRKPAAAARAPITTDSEPSAALVGGVTTTKTEAIEPERREKAIKLLRDSAVTAPGATTEKWVSTASDATSLLVEAGDAMQVELSSCEEVNTAFLTPPADSKAFLEAHTLRIYEIYDYAGNTPDEKACLLLTISLICAALSSTAFLGTQALAATPLYEMAKKYFKLALLVSPQRMSDERKGTLIQHLENGACSAVFSRLLLNWFMGSKATLDEVRKLLPPSWGRPETVRFE